MMNISGELLHARASPGAIQIANTPEQAQTSSLQQKHRNVDCREQRHCSGPMAPDQGLYSALLGFQPHCVDGNTTENFGNTTENLLSFLSPIPLLGSSVQGFYGHKEAGGKQRRQM